MGKHATIVAFAVLGIAVLAVAQNDQKPLSPPASAECKLPDGKTIETAYSSPRLRGRKMIGEHDPYGKPWRMGANEATTFVTNTDLTVGGKDVPAGNYTLFAIPSPDQWTLIVSTKTKEWGIPYPGEGSDLIRTEMKVSQLPSKVEDFTISYVPNGNGCTMNLDWDTTRASVDISEKK
jgi:DUF2911 family protein